MCRMTPAERASAVAFALKNCLLESMEPTDAALLMARDYELGRPDGMPFPSEASPLEKATADLVFSNTIGLTERQPPASGDLTELRAIHAAIFRGVMPDAGAVRRTDAAPDAREAAASNPHAFFPAALIETGAANIAAELSEAHNLRALDRPDFARSLAHFYDELGYLHPFPRGNAMTLRVFASRLSHDAGWDLDWGPVTAEEYKAAKRRAYGGDTTGFERLFASIMRPANPTRIFLISGWSAGPAH